MQINSSLSEHYTLRKFFDGETISGFDCGDSDLNEFAATDAPLNGFEYLQKDDGGPTQLLYFDLKSVL